MGNLFGRKKPKNGRGPAQTTSPGAESKVEIIDGGQYRYLKEEKLGQGTYGEVFACLQLPACKKVALKFTSQKWGKREAEILNLFSGIEAGKKCLLPLIESFASGQKYCLVFDRLDISLSTYLRQRQMRPLRIAEIRPIAQQLLVALQTLKSIGVVHADIKPDNVMLVNRDTEPLRVMLIDFGMANTKSEMEEGYKRMQAIGYRAPEVLLGMAGSEAVDMWAVGCLIARLFIGVNNLFPVHCPYEYMRAMSQLLGQPTDDILEASPKTRQFFARVERTPQDDTPPVSKFRLLTPSEFQEENQVYTYQRSSVYRNCGSIDDLPRLCRRPRTQTEKEDILKLMSLLKKMLRVDPKKRITPEQGLRHSFITMSHLAKKTERPYVREALDSMNVCQSVTGQELYARKAQHTVGCRTRLCLRRAASDISHQSPQHTTQTKAKRCCASAICVCPSKPGSVEKKPQGHTRHHHPNAKRAKKAEHHAKGHEHQDHRDTSHRDKRRLSGSDTNKKKQDGRSASDPKVSPDIAKVSSCSSSRGSSSDSQSASSGSQSSSSSSSVTETDSSSSALCTSNNSNP